MRNAWLCLKRSSVVWQRNFLHFQKTWMVTLFWVFLEPIFFYVALGFGLGAFVSSVDGLPYAEFFFPGLIFSSVMLVAFFSSTYENFSKLNIEGIYSSQLLTSLDARDILLGEVLWSTSKSLLSATAVLIIGFFADVVELAQMPSLILFSALTGALFSCFGMWVTARVSSYDQIIYPTSGLLIPMSLFCGTYFPLSQLPAPLQWLAQILPLTHSVSGARSLLLSGWTWSVGLRILGLLVFLLWVWKLALEGFQKRLEK